MKYTVYELVNVTKNISRGEYAIGLEPLYFEQNEFDTKEEAVKKIEELSKTKSRIQRSFTILEIYENQLIK